MPFASLDDLDKIKLLNGYFIGTSNLLLTQY